MALTRLSTAGDTAEVELVGSAGFEHRSLVDIESDHILATLNATDWNKSKTARILGIERSTLDRKILRYELTKNSVPRG